jgi:hypothetical protein
MALKQMASIPCSEVLPTVPETMYLGMPNSLLSLRASSQGAVPSTLLLGRKPAPKGNTPGHTRKSEWSRAVWSREESIRSSTRRSGPTRATRCARPPNPGEHVTHGDDAMRQLTEWQKL